MNHMSIFNRGYLEIWVISILFMSNIFIIRAQDENKKVVLVTGSAGGIGKATAELFNQKGAQVVLVARTTEDAKKLEATIPGSLALIADMTKPQEVQHIVRQIQGQYGRIDILINNAGHALQPHIEHLDVKDLAHVLSMNVYNPLVAMQATIPLMREQGGGAIVNISPGISKAIHLNTSLPVKTTSRKNKFSLKTRTETTEEGVSVSLLYPELPPKFVARRTTLKARHHRTKTEIRQSDSSETIAVKILETVEKGIAVQFL